MLHTNVFTYGTLSISEIMEVVTGKVFRTESAKLANFQCYMLADKNYPGIIYKDKSFTTGRVYFAVDSCSLERLDYFENPIYNRQEVTVITASGQSVCAQAYIIPEDKKATLTIELWDEKQFLQLHFANYLSRCKQHMRNKAKQN